MTVVSQDSFHCIQLFTCPQQTKIFLRKSCSTTHLWELVVQWQPCAETNDPRQRRFGMCQCGIQSYGTTLREPTNHDTISRNATFLLLRDVVLYWKKHACPCQGLVSRKTITTTTIIIIIIISLVGLIVQFHNHTTRHQIFLVPKLSCYMPLDLNETPTLLLQAGFLTLCLCVCQ